jgi:hypothetical protein
MIRSAAALTVAALVLAGCSKSTTTTAPAITDSFSVAGAWTGCLTEPGVQCSPLTMTLADSSLSDSTANITGTGNWGSSVAIKGKLFNSIVTLNATSPGVLQGWSFSGALSGSTVTGTMTVPDNASTFQAVFTKSP